MAWKKIRIDFTETVKCEFCHRDITAGKGVVVQNDNGDTAFSGPSCAKNPNKVSNPQEKIVDITKGCILTEPPKIEGEQERNQSNQNSLEDNFTPDDDRGVNNYLDENAVSAYLTLRFEKLAHLDSLVKSEKLSKIHEEYRDKKKISESDEKYIRAVMYGDRYPQYTYQNLQAVYAAEFWLLSFIANNPEDNLEFIQSNLRQLRSKLYLTPRQITGINNWFEHSDGKLVKLKISSFIHKNK